MYTKIGLIVKARIHNADELVSQIVTKLKSYKPEKILFDERAARAYGNNSEASEFKKIADQSDLVIIFGGDGTLLSFAREISQHSPDVLSINGGTTGFLTEVEQDDWHDAIEKVFSEKQEIDRRLMLEVQHKREGKLISKYRVLNDAVLSNGAKSRLIELPVKINQQKLNTYQADGLIIATPTGSTAHSLSAGGAIIHPHIQALLLTPICPISLSVRPLVIPADRIITIDIATYREQHERVTITMDGQICVPLEHNDQIRIVRNKAGLRLIRFRQEGYYRQLRKKLRWGR